MAFTSGKMSQCHVSNVPCATALLQLQGGVKKFKAPWIRPLRASRVFSLQELYRLAEMSMYCKAQVSMTMINDAINQQDPQCMQTHSTPQTGLCVESGTYHAPPWYMPGLGT